MMIFGWPAHKKPIFEEEKKNIYLDYLSCCAKYKNRKQMTILVRAKTKKTLTQKVLSREKS